MLNREKIIKELHHYNKKYQEEGFSLVSLFGSYARDENDIFSDIDLTYKINHEIFFKDNAFAKLAKIDEIKKELEDKFHKKVDLIPANTSNTQIQKTLQKEQVFI
jgi:predicted nucleotidyltransferase